MSKPWEPWEVAPSTDWCEDSYGIRRAGEPGGMSIAQMVWEDDARQIVREHNCFPELLAALKECSFRLATLVAVSGNFSDINAKVLDAASAAIANAEERS